MNIFESLRSAFASILSNKMRSMLTMLGIIIGISSVIMLTSIGSGFEKSLLTGFSKLGWDRLEVRLNRDEEVKNRDKLTFEDGDLIEAIPQVKVAAPAMEVYQYIKLRNPQEKILSWIIGSDQDYKNVQPIELKHGRFLMEADIQNKSKVIIIDDDLAKKIFGRVNCVGEKASVRFWFGDVELTVAGVYKAEAFNTNFGIPPMAFVPITFLMDCYYRDEVEAFYVTVADSEQMSRTATEITKLLELRHGNENKYRVQNTMSQTEQFTTILNAATAFVGLVAGISLLVGGIGIMNIMLVTVTERTREIGIRKSLGATKGNIMFQFLVEAVIITATGGLIGIVLGYTGGYFLGNAVKIMPVVSIPAVVGAVIASSLIGIFFGVFPAYKAAQLDPIEALRYE